MKWISVEDRLPERGQECLVSDGFSVTTSMYVNSGFDTWSAPLNCNIQAAYDYYSFLDFEPTDWAPLPKAPEKDLTTK